MKRPQYKNSSGGTTGNAFATFLRLPRKEDDADAAAGSLRKRISSTDSIVETEEPILVLGFNISHLSRRRQFIICASGVFGFSLLYGFLQELLSVTICGRQLGLFLAMSQFIGYTIWSYVLHQYVADKEPMYGGGMGKGTASSLSLPMINSSNSGSSNGVMDSFFGTTSTSRLAVPIYLYIILSVLRAIDLGMTNLAMQYVNYPAKTLMKSSRVVFTMLFGVLVARKRYKLKDYVVVALMVTGLAIFMHADANTSAVFDPLGIIMLLVSLTCDGAISNMSEMIMNQFGVGQDEFIFRMYSIALIAITAAASVKGDLSQGMSFLGQPGTYDEIHQGLPPTWSIMGKWTVLVLFSTFGFLGSSCCASITKNFGALTMSITSTVRKATTLFLSFALFDNECTMEHVGGIVLFISSLVFKSAFKGPGSKRRAKRVVQVDSELELAIESAPNSANMYNPGYHVV
eukprot:CAMPEP_0194029736 /NCGR_PEP_ID=MMETSP0009_2-20130614/3398_1 /TAXON_ID=210454 /ORGANISM="Grammatophora oceanica, Strain CCMP 410" /LENGTH=458 /DNA_ID=CAMNT_0038669503 /DNA_START=303 /DNA_END=1679 /DNA_ORIENTATION=+